MPTKQIAIYGAGGFGREVAWLVQSCNEDEERFQVVCFIDDDQALYGQILNGITVMGLESVRDQFPLARIVCGIGTPRIRQQLMEKAAAAGFECETFIHPRVERSQWVEIGSGSVICAGNILTTNIILGAHVQINIDCTIGHDVIIKDYATLCPGVHVSGCVHLGRRVFVGAGAVIINGTQEEPVTIGDDVVIGGGACVTQSLPANITAVGVPAKIVKRRTQFA